MHSARTRSAPPPRADARDSIRASRLLPFVVGGALALIGLVLLIFMALEKRPVKKASAGVADPQEPPSHEIVRAPPPMIEVPAVPHVGQTVTTETVLSSQGPDCYPCAKRNGCLDPAEQGGTCDDAIGEATGCGAGVTERDICYKTLVDVFTSKCAETLQETPCLCGDTDAVQCINGTVVPNGPILQDYACDFRTRDVTQIYKDFRETTYGVGRANSLIQCLGGYGCGCFGN